MNERALATVEEADAPYRPLQRIQHGPAPVAFDQEQVELIRTSIAKSCNPQQFQLFLATCRRTGLDPFAKQIYPLVQQGALAIITGIDGLRLIAARTGQLAGMSEPEWCGEDGEWRDVWLSPKPPAACRLTVYRRGCTRGFTATVLYREFARPNPNQPSGKWKDAPAHMLAVRAESHALRKAFPNEMSDVRLAEDEEIITVEPAPRPQARMTSEPAPRPALAEPQKPAANAGQQRANQAAKAGETGGNFAGASGAQNGDKKCEFCFAPEGRPHTRTCPTRTGETPAQSGTGEELEMQPTPPGDTPKSERERANKRLFAAYSKVGGDTSKGPEMLRHCELILWECLGESHRFTSRTQLTADQMDICAEWFETRQALPQEPQTEQSETLEYDDPFQDE